MIRVLHLFKTYFPESYGGIERVIFEICEGGLEHQVRSDVLTLSANSSKGVMQSLNSHRQASYRRDFELASTGFSVGFLLGFRNIAAKYDLIHYHFPWPFMDLAHNLLHIKKPYIVTYHADITCNSLLLSLYTPLMNKFLSGARQIVTTSNEYAASSQLIKRYATTSISLGISEQSYPHSIVTGRVRRVVESTDGYILSVGVYRSYKGFERIIDIASKFKGTLVLVSSGPRLNQLKSRIADSRKSNIILIENASEAEKMALLENCMAFLSTSDNRSEAFGIALVEAAMMGKPMITFELETGTSFVNAHQVTGFVISPIDNAGIVAAIETLQRNPALREKMGKNARKRFDEKLRSASMSDQYCALYKNVAAGSSNFPGH